MLPDCVAALRWLAFPPGPQSSAATGWPTVRPVAAATAWADAALLCCCCRSPKCRRRRPAALRTLRRALDERQNGRCATQTVHVHAPLFYTHGKRFSVTVRRSAQRCRWARAPLRWWNSRIRSPCSRAIRQTSSRNYRQMYKCKLYTNASACAAKLYTFIRQPAAALPLEYHHYAPQTDQHDGE